MKRSRSRGLAALSALPTVLLLAGPALADGNPLGPREGADPGPGLSAAGTLALFVIAPLVLIVVISALVLLPGQLRGARYRPTKAWTVPPVWFAGPVDPVAAVEHAELDDAVRGGGSGSW